MATKKLRILSTNLQSVVLPANIQRGLGTIDALKLKPEVVLSEKNRKSCIDRFKLYKAMKKLEGDVSQAAVLIPFCIHRGELGLLYTLRSSKLNSNRGQVSFPGGMHDKTDRDLEETALRETWEELKIPKEKVDVWTRGNFIRGKRMNIMPVLGYIGEVDPGKLEINPDEVEEAFVVPLNTLCEPSLCRFTQFRDSYTLPTYLGGKHRIWGLTAAITHIAMSALLPEVYKHKPIYLKPVNLLKEKTSTSSTILTDQSH
ncbi:hypothetical protein KPH14_006656 [Odynerus spinipes]|uniref:Nudix hydrolase domain-containing protein n=1 Tax=Odynerus spinipes TaxID=1348599 RepID=A0AAD9RRE8_9HYME|nr:hypothetical protein KPH14_006656 [Odynerus spinipes]